MAEHDEKKLTYDPLTEIIRFYSDKPAQTEEKAVTENLTLEERLKRNIIDGEKNRLEENLQLALGKYPPLDIINQILLDGMRTVGELFGRGEMQLPFVLQSAEVMKRAVAFLEPFMEKSGAEAKGTLVLATVKGDVHDIGKNLVDIILTNNGFRVVNLGIKCPVDAMLRAAEEHQAGAIGMSGLLVKSTQIMKENLEIMAERRWTIPVLLGGAALTKRYVDEDLRAVYGGPVHYCEDAFGGLRVMDELSRGENRPQLSDADPVERPADSLKEFIKRWKIARHKWNKTLAYFPDDDFAHGFYFGKWTLRDLIAHMTGWERLTLDDLCRNAAAFRPRTWTKEQIENQNQQSADENASLPKNEIIDRWNLVHVDFIAYLEEFCGNQVSAPLSAEHFHYLSELTYMHEYEHWKKVHAWLLHPDQAPKLKRSVPAKSTKVRPAQKIPVPPFWGTRVVTGIDLAAVFPFINEIALFRGQWQFVKGALNDAGYANLIENTARPVLKKWTRRAADEKLLAPAVVYGYFPCQSEGDDLIIYQDDCKTERMRFSFPRQMDEPFLCISDFFTDKSSGVMDVIGCHVVTVGEQASEFSARLFENHEYAGYLYFHGLSVETAEALAEYWHKIIRRELGIGFEDSPDIRKLFQQHYQGSRYSFGYPACPHLEDQKKLFELLEPERIGVKLSEEYQLHPEQSTSAIIVHHPQAKYFNVR